MFYVDKFLTEFLKLPLVNQEGQKIGKIEDLALTLGEVFPKVVGIVGKTEGKSIYLPLEKIQDITSSEVFVQMPLTKRTFQEPEEMILLKRDLLDKQIVDIDGVKVVRVNDLKIRSVGEDIRLVAADVSARAILRRLGLERAIEKFFQIFFIKLPEKLISWNFVEPFSKSFANVKLTFSAAKFGKMHPSDVAQIIAQVPFEEKLAIFESLNTPVASEVLHELEPEVQKGLVEGLKPSQAAIILENMPPDEASDVLGDLSQEKTSELLALIRPKDALAVRKLLKHKDTTAGGLMTTEFISMPENLTVQEVIEKLRETAPDAETIYYLYAVDENERLTGVLSLRKLIISQPQTVIKEIINTKLIKVKAEDDQKEVAGLISKYNLLAMPVVDHDGKILGIITVDDVMDLILPPLSRRKRFGIG